MTATAKHPISTGDGKGGKIVIPRGTKGSIIAVSNSKHIAKAFPDMEEKPDGYFYICCFPGYVEEMLCGKNEIDIS
jgi:hypothetical protein